MCCVREHVRERSMMCALRQWTRDVLHLLGLGSESGERGRRRAETQRGDHKRQKPRAPPRAI
eukprot:5834961-Prymnesium_polylepis.1